MIPAKATLKNSLTLVGLLGLPTLAHAGSPPLTFTYTSGALAVPVTPGALLIVLGLLLAVVAVRTLQNSSVAQRLTGLVVLAGGLTIGGLGIDKTIAEIGLALPIPADGSPCSGGAMNIGFAFHGGSTVIANNCDTDLVVESATAPGACADIDILIPQRVIPTGGTAPAPYCNPPLD